MRFFSTCAHRRFTLDELEGFLETAKKCIPGVREAVDAANSHKAHQVTHPYLCPRNCKGLDHCPVCAKHPAAPERRQEVCAQASLNSMLLYAVHLRIMLKNPSSGSGVDIHAVPIKQILSNCEPMHGWE